MGSIIGGLYAAGYSTNALKDIIMDIDWAETFSSEPRRRSSYISEKIIHEWPLFELRFKIASVSVERIEKEVRLDS